MFSFFFSKISNILNSATLIPIADQTDDWFVFIYRHKPLLPHMDTIRKVIINPLFIGMFPDNTIYFVRRNGQPGNSCL